MGIVSVALCAALLTGCVERRYVITTEPPGAVVLRNGQPLGATPVDDHFIYYGKYRFTIVKDSYETLQVDQEIPSPWYEWPLVDFVSEQLVPWPINDVRRFHYRLEPRKVPDTNELLKDAQNLRNRGMSLGGGSAAPPPGTPLPPTTSPSPASLGPLP